MLLANFNRKEYLRHRAVSLRQHGFLVSCVVKDLITASQRGYGSHWGWKIGEKGANKFLFIGVMPYDTSQNISACLSLCGIVSKWLNVSSKFFQHLIRLIILFLSRVCIWWWMQLDISRYWRNNSVRPSVCLCLSATLRCCFKMTNCLNSFTVG